MNSLTPELAVVLLNIAIIAVAYGSVYPKLAGSNVQKISLYDLVASALALLIVGVKYWGTGTDFTLLFVDVNWFWFTFISYFILELPVVFWYIKKHGVKLP